MPGQNGGRRPGAGRPKGARSKRTLRRAGALARLLKNEALADKRWAEEVLRLALQDTRIFYDEHGNLLPPQQWTAEHGALIAASETIIKNAEAGDGHTDRILKLRHWDKLRALELWGKYRSLLIERQELRHTFSLEDLVAGSREME